MNYFKEVEKLTDSENLVERNLKWAAKMAYKYKRNSGTKIPVEDLIQQANYGLVVAAEKYNPESGNKFLTYAQAWILKYIKAALGNENSILKIPGSFQHKDGVIRNAIKKIKGTNPDIEPTVSEISAVSGFSEKIVKKVMKLQPKGEISLNQKFDDGKEVSSVISEFSSASAIKEIEFNDDMKYILSKIDSLPEKYGDAIKMKYLEEKTLREIKETLNIKNPDAYINKGLKMVREMINK
jgi:RNA polymerase sigma factor (sigma-70 family)